MTPEQKANDLIKKFEDYVNPYIGSGMLSNTYDDSAILFQSIKCAIVVCDEVINALDPYSLYELEYYTKVKQILEKM